MAIRLTKYNGKGAGKRPVRAVRVTERNFRELVAWLAKRGVHAVAQFRTNLETGDESNHKIRIKQKTGEKRRDYRVAVPGDFIVELSENEFARVKEDDFEASYERQR